MKITIQPHEWENDLQLIRAFENVQWPEYTDRSLEIVLDAPHVTKFVNCFLNSNLNARVTITPPADDVVSVNYAGLFSGCRELNAQPVFDCSKNISMAAMFKMCENIRFSLHNIDTSKVVDFRQCFWGAKNYSGNGVQSWDYSSARSPDALSNFFGGGSGMRTIYYDQFIEHLHDEMLAGTLPTPMSPVNMGTSQYSPYVAKKREQLIDYGWDIVDSGEVPYELSPLEAYFSETIDSRLKSNAFPGDIDFGPVCLGSRNGILITPRHTIHVKHYMPSVGQEMVLGSGESVVVESIDAGFMGLDIGIATLKTEATTRPALALLRNWKDWMPLLGGPPTSYPKGAAPAVIRFKRGGVPTVNDMAYVGKNQTPSAACIMPVDPLRLQHYSGINVGDSGSAVCFVYDNRLVLAYSLTSSDGSGIAISGDLRNWIDGIVSKTGQALQDCPVRPPIVPL